MVLAELAVLTVRAPHLANVTPSLTAYSRKLGICTSSLCRCDLYAGRGMRRFHASMRLEASGRRTNGGKINTDSCADFETGNDGDGAAYANRVFGHSNAVWQPRWPGNKSNSLVQNTLPRKALPCVRFRAVRPADSGSCSAC